MDEITFFAILVSSGVFGFCVFSLIIKNENDFKQILRLLFKIYVGFGIGVLVLWMLHFISVLAVLVFALLIVLETINMKNQFDKGYYCSVFRPYESSPWKRRFIFNLSLNFSMLFSVVCLIVVKVAVFH